MEDKKTTRYEVIDELFKLAAKEWEYGNNSGDPRILAQYTARCNGTRKNDEEELKIYGIQVEYPGLNPIFWYQGRTFYTAMEAIDYALNPQEENA